MRQRGEFGSHGEIQNAKKSLLKLDLYYYNCFNENMLFIQFSMKQ